MKLYCIRHGQAEQNLSNTINEDPSKPIHLTEKGKKQVEESATILKDKEIELIFISEFPRTKETAKIINKYHDVPIIVDKKLNEIFVGFEGQNAKEWIDFISSDILNNKKEGFESCTDIITRVGRFIESLKNRKEKEIAIVSHGTPIQAIKFYLDVLPKEETLISGPKNAEIVELSI